MKNCQNCRHFLVNFGLKDLSDFYLNKMWMENKILPWIKTQLKRPARYKENFENEEGAENTHIRRNMNWIFFWRKISWNFYLL